MCQWTLCESGSDVCLTENGSCCFSRAPDPAACWPDRRMRVLLAVEMFRCFKLLLLVTPHGRARCKLTCICTCYLYAHILVHTHSSATSTVADRNTHTYIWTHIQIQANTLVYMYILILQQHTYTLMYFHTDMPVLTLSHTYLRTQFGGSDSWPYVSAECVRS